MRCRRRHRRARFSPLFFETACVHASYIFLEEKEASTSFSALGVFLLVFFSCKDTHGGKEKAYAQGGLPYFPRTK